MNELKQQESANEQSKLFDRLRTFQALSWISPICRVEVGALDKKLSESILNLVFIGQYKRGKSSLINALIGKGVLPVGALPLTSVVTILCHGPGYTTVFYLDGHSEVVNSGRLSEYITEEKNPENEKLVKLVEVQADFKLLESGMRIIDTPGLDSMNEHNTEATLSYLPQADAAVLVLSADQPLSVQEMQFLQKAKPNLALMLVALNKIDLLSEQDLASVVTYIRESLVKFFPYTSFEIFPVSSKWANEGFYERSGIEKLRERFEKLVRDEKKGIELVAGEKKFENLLDSESSLLRARLKFLSEKEEWRSEKNRELNLIFEATQENQRALSYSINGEYQDLVKRFNELTDKLAKETLGNIDKRLNEFSSQGSIFSREYLAKCYDIIQGTLSEGLKTSEPLFRQFLEKEYGGFLDRYNDRISSLLSSAYGAASKVLDLSLPSHDIENRFRLSAIKAVFNPSLSVSTLGGFYVFALSWLPSKLSRILLKSHFKRVMEDAVYMNYEGLRWEFFKTLDKDFRTNVADLNARVLAIKSTLESVMFSTTQDYCHAHEESESEVQQIIKRSFLLRDLYKNPDERNFDWAQA
ncbi:MAG TPA: dynamin family protein [Bdellovibrio sp.]|uniref:dynamin family protein n=1 Tax=Bdellovibrio sp. TaxID=28201 RepID=UPI002F22E9AE